MKYILGVDTLGKNVGLKLSDVERVYSLLELVKTAKKRVEFNEVHKQAKMMVGTLVGTCR